MNFASVLFFVLGFPLQSKLSFKGGKKASEECPDACGARYRPPYLLSSLMEGSGWCAACLGGEA